MLNIESGKKYSSCDGPSRRDFLRISSVIPISLLSPIAFGQNGNQYKDKSVIWIWMGGGASHIETFNPCMESPLEYRSTTGECKTKIPGFSVGGTFPSIAEIAHYMNFVRGFSHKNSGHAGGTHWLMTGYDNKVVDNGGSPTRPSIGSIIARINGINSPNGVPTYVSFDKIVGDGPEWLGSPYAPFNPNGEARQNMELRLKIDHFNNRKGLLSSLDRMRSDMEVSKTSLGMDEFHRQAYNVILGDGINAFDIDKEDEPTKELYGVGELPSRGFGRRLLMARRLAESGAKFITVSYGGWDMHQNIKTSMENNSPEFDRGVFALINDILNRNLQENILVVISGEFGRTPKVNGTDGRDHWPLVSTLAFFGGGSQRGNIIGETDKNATSPNGTPVTPQDVLSTMFKHFGIDQKIQFADTAGRPTYMIEDGRPIDGIL